MTRPAPETPRILSIQSHVVHGYVGNKAATFPLQIRGWDVDVLNTVQFSNHPAYGSFRGQKCTPEALESIFSGLLGINVEYDVVLTGYIPSDDALKAVDDICRSLCQSSGIKWVLDPVLGDHGRIYVSEGNIGLYKTILQSGNVYCVTPNQLELEVLSGVKVKSLQSLKEAIVRFNDLYPVEHVVVTSVELENDQDHLYSAGCTRSQETGELLMFYFKVAKIHASFSGSGDLFSAILTSALFKYNERMSTDVTEATPLEKIPLNHALNEALSVVAKVLELTFEYEMETLKGETVPENIKINDLRLIQAKDIYDRDLSDFVVSRL